MGFFRWAFGKHSVFGKIAKVAVPALAGIGGLLIGGHIIKSVAGGIGNLIHRGATGSAGGLSLIAEKAKAFVNGLTKEQQGILDEAKNAAKDAKQQLKLAKKLMATGMSQDEAYSKAGIPKNEPTHTEETSEYNSDGSDQVFAADYKPGDLRTSYSKAGKPNYTGLLAIAAGVIGASLLL